MVLEASTLTKLCLEDANSHSGDSSSVVSSHFVKEVRNLCPLLSLSYSETPTLSTGFLLMVTTSAFHRLTSYPHTESRSGLWHLIIPNASLHPLFLVLCHFDFAFWICLWLLPPSFFFGTMILTLSFPSPFLTWRDVQHVIVRTSRAGHLNANDWKTNAAGFKGENFFPILSQAKHFYFSPILNGEQETEPFKQSKMTFCARTWRVLSTFHT